MWVRLPGRSQLSNPSDLPCWISCTIPDYYLFRIMFHSTCQVQSIVPAILRTVSFPLIPLLLVTGESAFRLSVVWSIDWWVGILILCIVQCDAIIVVNFLQNIYLTTWPNQLEVWSIWQKTTRFNQCSNSRLLCVKCYMMPATSRWCFCLKIECH